MNKFLFPVLFTWLLTWCYFIRLSLARPARPAIVDVVITVKTDKVYVRQVVESVVRYRPDDAILRQRVIFVDDGSPIETQNYIAGLCNASSIDFICLATTQEQPGYTFAVNMGVSFGRNYSEAIVLLNSDTIVTDGWLIKLYRELFERDPKVRIVGPLSNAASFQSVPATTGSNGDWSVNPFPPGMNIKNFASEIEEYAIRTNILPVPIMVLNGFCYMFRRQLMDEIGEFDSIHFPSGYGEEVDFSIRVWNAGFLQHIVPSVYVWHKKTASFVSSNKKELKMSSRQHLVQSYGKEIFKKIDKVYRVIPELDGVRNYSQQYYNSYKQKYKHFNDKASILFVMHDLAIAGGIVSVLQEAWQMYKLGVKVSIAFPMNAAGGNYTQVIRALLPGIDDKAIIALSRTYDGSLLNINQSIPISFIHTAREYDIVVATFCKTMRAVQYVARKYPRIMPAYYIQDYELWFWESPFEPNVKTRDLPGLLEARSTYAPSSSHMISKTKWTANMIQKYHHAHVNMVVPSLDHNVYYPNNTALAEKMRKKGNSSIIQVIAMVRPRTPRRNALNTLEVTLRLAYNYPQNVKVVLFGCTRAWLNNAMKQLVKQRGKYKYRQKSLPILSNIEFKGLLVGRKEMGDLYRSSDIFIDLSWWQAFGRTAMEAMATGCVAIMPLVGAADEICNNGKYCLHHDGNDVDGFYNKLEGLIHDDKLRRSLINKGIIRVSKFVLEVAATSIVHQLKAGYAEYKKNSFTFH